MEENIFSKHFLSNFFYSHEPFVIYDNILYTVSKKSDFNSPNHIKFMDKAYVLEEADNISELEKNFFDKHKKQIEEMMTKLAFDEFNRKIENAQKELDELKKHILSFEKRTVESFIAFDIFDAYNHEGWMSSTNKPEESKKEPSGKPKVELFYPTESYLKELINGRGFLSINNKCYNLEINRKEVEGYHLNFGKNAYKINLWLSLEELCQNYSQKLNEELRKNTLEQSQELKKNLDKIIKQKEIASKEVEKTESRGNKRGEISYKKEGDEYRVEITVPPFIIEKKDKYYAFNQVTLGLNLIFKSEKVMLKNKPDIKGPYYRHPFVFVDGEICFGDLAWYKQRGIKFNKEYNLSNKKWVARLIAEVLREGKKTLERGYINDKLRPVNELMDFEPVAHNREEAVNYAKNNGIDVLRIINNN